MISYFADAHTDIQLILKQDPKARRIDCNSGVRQGDPISCHLFNFAMAMAIAEIPDVVGFHLDDDLRFQHGLLADDTFLVAESPEGLQSTFTSFERALEAQGMQLNAAKCKTLTIDTWPKEKVWFVPKTSFLETQSGESVEALSIMDSYKYLGVRVSAEGIRDPKSEIELREQLNRLQHCELRPQHKLHILRSVVIPMMYYSQTLGDLAPKRWKAFDKAIRHFVRNILHLPEDTPKGFFHASHRDGGMGIHSLQSQIHRLRRNRIESLFESTDPVLKFFIEEDDYIQKEFDRQNVNLSINQCVFGTTKKSCVETWRTILHQSVDGRGLAHHQTLNPYRSAWVIDRFSVLSGREFVSALQTRGALLKSVARGARQSPGTSLECPKCDKTVCNLSHLLQVCPIVKDVRIERHEEVVSGIARAASRQGYEVLYEPQIPVKPTWLKPDLVLIKKGEIIVIDPTVVADNADLEDTHRLKTKKYDIKEIREYLQRLHKEKFPTYIQCDLRISGAILDWRGCWSALSHRFLT